jgi:hypothetical protein
MRFSFQADDASERTYTLGQQMKNTERTATYIDDVPSRLNPNAIQKKASPGFVIDRLLDEPLLLDLSAAQRVIASQTDRICAVRVGMAHHCWTVA